MRHAKKKFVYHSVSGTLSHFQELPHLFHSHIGKDEQFCCRTELFTKGFQMHRMHFLLDKRQKTI